MTLVSLHLLHTYVSTFTTFLDPPPLSLPLDEMTNKSVLHSSLSVPAAGTSRSKAASALPPPRPARIRHVPGVPTVE